MPTHFFIVEFPEENCVEKCPDGFYPILSPNKICRKCKKECATCTTETICNTCNDTFYHNPNTFECKENCDDGFIKIEQKNSCLECDKKCRTCKDKIDNCTSCKDTFLLENNCVKECPGNMFKDMVYYQCEYCHNSCLTCKGGREKDCLTCDKEKKLSLIFGYCTEGCPSGTIREKGGRDCINFQNCFNSLILSAPKLFSITDNDYHAELMYQLKEECFKYAQDLAFVWDEVENAEVSGKKLTLKTKHLKEGKL